MNSLIKAAAIYYGKQKKFLADVQKVLGKAVAIDDLSKAIDDVELSDIIAPNLDDNYSVYKSNSFAEFFPHGGDISIRVWNIEHQWVGFEFYLNKKEFNIQVHNNKILILKDDNISSLYNKSYEKIKEKYDSIINQDLPF